MVQEYITQIDHITDFALSADIAGRQEWGSLPGPLRQALIREGEKRLGYTYPVLTASDYMEFSEMGNRSHYEEAMFDRRRALNALVLAECTENSGRFLKDIINGIYCILEESTWCVPAHNTYIRDTPQEPLADYTRPVIDLFAGETAAVLAVAEYLLRPVLEKVSPLISRDINFRLRERILTPYFEQHFWWMGDGKSQMNNWTVWVTQNILLAAFTRPDAVLPPERKRAVLDKAAASVDYFLAEYGEDSCCDEGAQYYDRAGISLFHCLDIMDRVTGGALCEVFRQPKIRNIADYIRKVHIKDNCYVNFADCSLKAGRRGAGEYLFGKRAGLPALSAFAAEDFVQDEDRLLTDEQSLYRRLVQIMHWNEMETACRENSGTGNSEMGNSYTGNALPAGAFCPEDAWFPSAGLMVSRDSRFLLAAKAGSNGDSHNHNDVGSFMVFKDGEPLFIDLGVETYCKKTFSEQRYEIWTMQSQYHNLPAFGGFLQQAGRRFCASDVSCTMDGKRAVLHMEISGAYRLRGSDTGSVRTPDGTLTLTGGAEQIRSYTRTVSHTKEEGILIEDYYDGDLPAVLSLMTKNMPRIHPAEGNRWELSFGDLAVCTVTGASTLKAENIPLNDPKLRDAWGGSACRILAEIQEEIHLKIR